MAGKTPTCGRETRPPNGLRTEEGVYGNVPNVLLLLSEKLADSYLSASHSDKTQREASHFICEGYSYK